MTFAHMHDLGPNIWSSTGINPENVKKLIEIIKKVVKEFYEKGNLFDSTIDLVCFVGSCHGGNSRLKAVNKALENSYNLTVEDVNRVIKKYFNSAKLVFVDAGKLFGGILKMFSKS